MDFFYKQYTQSFSDNDKSNSNSDGYNIPYKEVVEYFEKYKNVFSYSELSSICANVNSEVDVTLKDGTKVYIEKDQEMIKLVVKQVNGNSFYGCWNLTQDASKIFK